VTDDDPDADPEDVFDGPPEELQAAIPPVSASPVATTATRLMMLFLINCAFLSLCDAMMESLLILQRPEAIRARDPTMRVQR
jgi:hypothetical protein